MNRSVICLSIAAVLVVASLPVQAFDYMKKKYAEIMLGSPLYQVLQDKIGEGTCTQLKEREDLRRVVVENNYALPTWVSIFSKISPNESLFSYADSLYRVMQNVLNVVETQLKSQFPQISIESGQVRIYMNLVLVSRDENVNQENINTNIDKVKGILNGYKTKVEVSQQAIPEEKKRILNSIDSGLMHINKASQRLTRIERWHRNKQIERFNNYVVRYCK